MRTSSGILEVEKETGKTPYEQIKELRGIQWPAPTAAIAKAGGTKRRYMAQEEYWPGKPYGEFRHPDGKLHIHMCQQDYSRVPRGHRRVGQGGYRSELPHDRQLRHPGEGHAMQG